MAQRAKILANTPDDLSQILRTHMVEGENSGSSKFSSDLPLCTMVHVCVSCVCVCMYLQYILRLFLGRTEQQAIGSHLGLGCSI